MNNPSNPVGAVYAKKQLESLLQVAFKYKIPIIADEVYGRITFHNAEFYPLASLEPKVPILTCDSISKRYLSPGARLGWIIIHDRYGALKQVRFGITSLAQKICGPCTLIQGALPDILDNTPASFLENIRSKLGANADAAYQILSQIPGLQPVKPEGAMYLSICINEKIYGTEKLFLQKLINEENVYCLPGSAFFYPGMIRLALIYPKDVIVEACNRIANFCRTVYSNKK